MAWCLVAYNNATPKLLLVASVAIYRGLRVWERAMQSMRICSCVHVHVEQARLNI